MMKISKQMLQVNQRAGNGETRYCISGEWTSELPVEMINIKLS
jgi:hypothetical protein